MFLNKISINHFRYQTTLAKIDAENNLLARLDQKCHLLNSAQALLKLRGFKSLHLVKSFCLDIFHDSN